MSAINETLNIDILEKGYEAKEWKDSETSGKDKHRVYVVGPSGEIGYLFCLFQNISGITFNCCWKIQNSAESRNIICR